MIVSRDPRRRIKAPTITRSRVTANARRGRRDRHSRARRLRWSPVTGADGFVGEDYFFPTRTVMNGVYSGGGAGKWIMVPSGNFGDRAMK